ncbi:MAG: hypothetical protein E7406_00320 [Ruminococcaceae bacterium]|nr:hypothetical protein [Oscillospiraceae bacterium]
MKSNSVYKEAAKVSAIIFILGVIEFILFTVFMGFRLDILIGVLYGCAFTSLNFFYLAFCVKKAVEKDEKAAKAYMSSTYTARILLLGVMLFIAAKVQFIYFWAAVIPIVFQRIAATVVPIIERRREKA